MSKTSKLEIIISSIVICFSAIVIFLFNNQQQKINSQTAIARAELSQKKKELRAIPSQVQRKLEKENPNSGNLKSVNNFNEMKRKGSKLMRLMYTVNSDGSQAEWTKRNQEMSKLATKEALEGAGSNYKSQGLNRLYDLKQTYLGATFTSGSTGEKDTVKGIILANFRQSSNQQDNPEEQQQAYTYTYSLKEHKFTSLILFGIVKDSKY